MREYEFAHHLDRAIKGADVAPAVAQVHALIAIAVKLGEISNGR